MSGVESTPNIINISPTKIELQGTQKCLFYLFISLYYLRIEGCEGYGASWSSSGKPQYCTRQRFSPGAQVDSSLRINFVRSIKSYT